MGSIAVNPPKTPVTAGSNGISAAATPNVCKMPGPPAPFVPTPLPNVGRSGDSQSGYSKKVIFQGKKVAIKGASFKSKGDVASKGTGGGLISATTHGKTKFVAPGSMTVKAEGKNIHVLGDVMTNNCNMANGGQTLPGVVQDTSLAIEALQKIVCKCDANTTPDANDNCMSLGEKKHECCNREMHRHNREKRMPRIGLEAGYSRKTGNAVPGSRMKLIGEYFLDFIKRVSGKVWPDAAILDIFGRPVQFAEFKFQCPKGVPTRRGAGPSKGTTPQGWTPGKNGKPGQLDKTIALGLLLDPEVTMDPELITNEQC